MMRVEIELSLPLTGAGSRLSTLMGLSSVVTQSLATGLGPHDVTVHRITVEEADA